MSEPRTVTLATVDHGDVVLPEPSWCVGHADHQPDSYRADLTHCGPEHRLTFDGAELFRLAFAQTPLAERASRDVCAFLQETGYTGSLDPVGLYGLAAALESAADQLRVFADELATLHARDAL